MESYTEGEIRAAFGEAGKSPLFPDELIRELKKARGDRVHAIWDGSDTVTVKELLEAEKRQSSMLYSVEQLLNTIDKSREPEYPYQSVWKDRNDVVWQRTAKKMWRKMGEPGEYSHDHPKRPLKRMDVI